MNRATLRPHTTATPYEMWFGKKPNLNYLRTFGTSCHIPKGTQGSSKKKQGILIGYAPYSPNYHVLDIATYEVIETWSICIDEVSELDTQSPIASSIDHVIRSVCTTITDDYLVSPNNWNKVRKMYPDLDSDNSSRKPPKSVDLKARSTDKFFST